MRRRRMPASQEPRTPRSGSKPVRPRQASAYSECARTAILPFSTRTSYTGCADVAGPWSAAPLLVTSIDFVKRPDIIRALEPIMWDVVVFDEAHALAGHDFGQLGSAAHAQTLTISLGVAIFPRERIRTIDDLIREADWALYRAKGDAWAPPEQKRLPSSVTSSSICRRSASS